MLFSVALERIEQLPL
jgi:ParB-like chromosome segregation protein Spo0J